MLSSARSGPAVVARDHTDARLVGRVAAEMWILVGLTVVAAALRFATIRGQSYWLDEATTVHELGLPFGAMLHSVRVNETTPPLYFVLAWVWAKVFGTGEVGLRSLSALAGIAVVPLAYLSARELISRRAGVVAAALVAVSPFLIWYSQEARSYMLFTAFCAASFLYFARGLRRPSTANVWLWCLFSSLAVLTHFFAGFLVVPEAFALLYMLRDRLIVVATGVVAVVQAAVLPLAISDTSHPLNWIQAFPLGTRLQQIPVALWLGNLYRSSLVKYGLWIAVAVAAAVVVVLVIGASTDELRGAGIAAAVAAFVVFVPIVLALAGSDYVVARNFAPAWVPLAVVVGAACTTERGRAAGAAIAVIAVAAFIWAGVRVDSHTIFQRPNWRGVAAALGTPTGPRAIVAYDGTYATAPLAIYLPGVAWFGPGGQDPQPGPAPVTVSEVDVIGSSFDQPPATLPVGVTRISSKVIDGYAIERYALTPSWRGSRGEIGSRASALLIPSGATPGVIVQRPA